jgi:hypothetical protein
MSENQFAQEFLCDFAAGNEAALLSIHQVTESMRRNPREEAYSFAPKIIGVDVARFGDDRSCVIRRQGLACFAPAVYRGKEGFELADIVARVIIDWRPDAVFVDDTGGYGGTVIERLRQLGHQCIGVQFGGKASNERYLNKRAEMWIDMAQWVKEGGALPNSPELRSDLCAPTYKHNAAGKFQLESKEDMKKRGMPSPDCFIAGTMIETPHGERPIESLTLGDVVSTPMGARVVIATHRVVAHSLTTVAFSTGRALTGKGTHRVFTWDRGWLRMDALAKGNEIETLSVWTKTLWLMHRMCFMTDKNTGFKTLADTINPGGRQTRRGFFTGAFGDTLTARFRRAIQSTTRMATRPTTTWPTWNVCQPVGINPSICMSECLTPNIASDLRHGVPRQSSMPPHVIARQKELHGTNNTAKMYGLEESQSLCNAHGALSHFSPSCHGLSSAPPDAPTRGHGTVIKRQFQRVLNAAKSFFTISIGSKIAAAISVQTVDVDGCPVYNLTLDRDNVYYANGVLVENCGDALALTFASPVAVTGYQANARQTDRFTPTTSDYNPIRRR